MARATFLLAARDRFGGQRLSPDLARMLGRADASVADAGERAQLRRHFSLVPDHWPLAALTRRVDASDAEGARWLRADPAHIRPDINGARLMACGDALQLDRGDADAFLPALKPLFGDTGFPIDAPIPGHWYLRLPREAKLPAFSEPADALGGDLFDHIPDGDAGRRWRSLLSEAQVILHQHPRNALRTAQGRLPVNSLWFWGGGVLPDAVASGHARLQSDDEIARAIAHGACAVESLPERYLEAGDDLLVDLRHLRDVARLQREWWQPAAASIANGTLQGLRLDFGDGHVVDIARSQRWRFWRKPQSALL